LRKPKFYQHPHAEVEGDHRPWLYLHRYLHRHRNLLLPKCFWASANNATLREFGISAGCRSRIGRLLQQTAIRQWRHYVQPAKGVTTTVPLHSAQSSAAFDPSHPNCSERMRIVRDGELAVEGDSPCSIRSDTAAAFIPGWLAVRETPRSRIGHIAIGMLVLENIDAVLRRRPAPFLVTSHEYHQARLAHK
jgi:hypothetical protein